MAYKSFKKNLLLIGFTVSVCSKATMAFQHAVVGGRRRPFASVGFSQEQEQEQIQSLTLSLSQPQVRPQRWLTASDRTILYYKNLDEHEEQQLDEGEGNINIINNGALFVEGDKDFPSNTTPSTSTTTTTSASVSVSASTLPNVVDLPKAVFIKSINNQAQTTKLQELFLSTEMLIGRIAIVMAVSLLAQEILTGSSTLDQLQHL